MNYKSKKLLAICCHDAGGANIISNWLENNKLDFFAILSGPSKDIFKIKFPNLEIVTIQYALNRCNWVLTGSSLYSVNENKIIKLAKEKNIKTCTFLDHWINFKARFKYKNKYVYPDEIWVGDKMAHEIAQKNFKNIKIIRKVNPYWVNIKKKYQLYKYKKNYNVKKINILFASTYIVSNSEIKLNSTQIARNFFQNIESYYPLKKINKVIFRNHPREKIEKYYNLKMIYPKIEFDNNKELTPSLFSSHYVVGCESMVLVLAKILGLHTTNIYIGSKKLSTIPKKYINRQIYLG